MTGLGSKTISNIREALDTAYAYGVVVSMCLFSFDLLVPGDGTGKAAYSSFNLDNNYKFLTVPANIDTYLNKALKPILDSVGSHPAVLCWEVFNEPEGMLAAANWANVTKKITQNDILRITNKIAGFVHRNSTKMASTGIVTFQYATEYSKAKLIAAGGDNDGFLDFYMVHYYPEWQEGSISPFQNPASNWNMDRPILIGEFPAKSWSTSDVGPSSNQPFKTSKTINDAFAYAYSNGYAGALSWSMTGDPFLGDYTTTAPALQALFTAHKSDIMIKDVTIAEMTGNYVMKVDFAGVPIPSGTTNYFELGTTSSKNFTGKSNLLFEVFVKPGSAKNLQFQPVIKVNSSYTWSPAAGNILNLNSVEQGKWITVTVPVTAFGASSVSDVREILFQWWATGTPYASGTVYFDNVRVDSDTLGNFNSAGSAWFTAAGSAKVSLVKFEEVGILYDRNAAPVSCIRSKALTVQGMTIVVHSNRPSDTKIDIMGLSGRIVAGIDCGKLSEGDHAFSVKGLTSGRYIVKMRQAMILFRQI